MLPLRIARIREDLVVERTAIAAFKPDLKGVTCFAYWAILEPTLIVVRLPLFEALLNMLGKAIKRVWENLQRRPEEGILLRAVF